MRSQLLTHSTSSQMTSMDHRRDAFFLSEMSLETTQTIGQPTRLKEKSPRTWRCSPLSKRGKGSQVQPDTHPYYQWTERFSKWLGTGQHTLVHELLPRLDEYSPHGLNCVSPWLLQEASGQDWWKLLKVWITLLRKRGPCPPVIPNLLQNSSNRERFHLHHQSEKMAFTLGKVVRLH